MSKLATSHREMLIVIATRNSLTTIFGYVVYYSINRTLTVSYQISKQQPSSLLSGWMLLLLLQRQHWRRCHLNDILWWLTDNGNNLSSILFVSPYTNQTRKWGSSAVKSDIFKWVVEPVLNYTNALCLISPPTKMLFQAFHAGTRFCCNCRFHPVKVVHC